MRGSDGGLLATWGRANLASGAISPLSYADFDDRELGIRIRARVRARPSELL
jgi:hypothetical protein